MRARLGVGAGVVAIGLASLPVGRAAADEPAPAATSPAAATTVTATKPAVADERGPADALMVEAEVGYGVGAFTAIQGHDPKVPHGPMTHFGLGWAWTVRTNQSIGVEAFAEGTFDGDKTTSAGAAFAGRYGAAAFVYGERAHLRLGFGYAHATMDGSGYSGLGVSFAAGWQVPLGPRKGWKYPAFLVEVLPSWDFLGAGSETLHRWNFGVLLGLAVL